MGVLDLQWMEEQEERVTLGKEGGGGGALLSCSRPPRAQWAEKTEPGEVRSWAPGRKGGGLLSFWFAFSWRGPCGFGLRWVISRHL